MAERLIILHGRMVARNICRVRGKLVALQEDILGSATGSGHGVVNR
jgi:hypothetical protein